MRHLLKSMALEKQPKPRRRLPWWRDMRWWHILIAVGLIWLWGIVEMIIMAYRFPGP